jgi:hypothetical protein
LAKIGDEQAAIRCSGNAEDGTDIIARGSFDDDPGDEGPDNTQTRRTRVRFMEK